MSGKRENLLIIGKETRFSAENQPKRRRGKTISFALNYTLQEVKVKIQSVMLNALQFSNRDEALKYLKAEADKLPEYGFLFQIIINALSGKNGFAAAMEIHKTIFGSAPVVTETIDGASAQRDELNSIARRWNRVSQKYQSFLTSTIGERHVFLQGGRRSAKTFSTFIWLQYRAALLNDGEPLNIMVVCYQFPQLQKTMDDFTSATGVQINGSTKEGAYADTIGAHWNFQHFDSKEKAQGTKCDILFINEAPNVSQEVAEVLFLGVRLQCIYNFNPTKTFWGNEFFNERNLLCTTWRDNSFLTDEQRGEFEKLRERAQRPTATTWDTYNYKVYYLGEFAQLVGGVFHDLETCSASDYFEVPSKEVIGMDFGFSTSGDPTTCVGVKAHGGRIYVHEYIYERGLTSNAELAERLKACGINTSTTIFADYGGQGRGRMDALIRSHGFNFKNAVKGSIMDGLSNMLAMDGITITDCSTATRAEFEGYELDENGRPNGDDHAIDAARYAFNYIIKKI